MAYKTHQKESIELRFDEGYRVECNCGEWKPGTIVKAWYREDSWEEDSWAAYQVQLDDGNLIFAPIDDDNVIRKAAAGSVSPYNPTERTEPMTWEEIGKWDTAPDYAPPAHKAKAPDDDA